MRKIQQFQALRAVTYQLAENGSLLAQTSKKESPSIMVRLLFVFDKLLCLSQFVN